MSFAGSQAQTLLRLLRHLRPHWRTDVNLPRRIQTLLAGERAFGSRDRRFYRELIYTTLRYLPWIEPLLDANESDEAIRRLAHLAAETPATRSFRAAFATGAPPDGDKAELLPAWFRAHCPEAFEPAQLDALLTRAPLWIRLQTDNVQLAGAYLDSDGFTASPSPVLHSAWRLPDDSNITLNAAYLEGLVEIQDLGSQLILASVGVMPGDHWLDACAGAGGKTLQLSRLLGPAGRVTAHDVRNDALNELRSRAIRAGIPHDWSDEKAPPISKDPRGPAGITILRDRPTGVFEGVLVDAPCSGSGTWRRAPHLKWTTTEAQILAAAEKQFVLLSQFSVHVRSGGRLVYATCSLSRRENEDVVARFLAAHPDFAPVAPARTFGFAVRGHGVTILPAQHDTDGFFFAVLRRI